MAYTLATVSVGAEVAPVHHPLGLAGEAFDGARLHQRHFGADAGDGVDLPGDAFAQGLHAVHAIGEELGTELHLDPDPVQGAGAVDLDEVCSV